MVARSEGEAPRPKHVAIIGDGSGRWAERQGLPRIEGHRAAEHAILSTVDAALEVGLRWLTVYAFSVDNWKRPEDEVRLLLLLMEELMAAHVGRRDDRVPDSLGVAMDRAVDRTRMNSDLILTIAFNYGGREEILDAIDGVLRDSRAVSSPATPVSAEQLRRHLYFSGAPDPDLIIRCGGELRLSNFMLWQAAYAELWFTSKFWPDFGRQDLRRALNAYSRRQRRFGNVPSVSG
jgi:undecaprenyl diphosphate synthase